MENIDLVNAKLINVIYKEFDIIIYTFSDARQTFDLTSLKNDEIYSFLREEDIVIGSEMTLIITKDNLEVIGLVSKETSNMILFKDKKTLAYVKVDYNYYERKLASLNISKRQLEETIKSSEEIASNNVKMLTLISVRTDIDNTFYVFRYYDQSGEERYASYKINNEEKLFEDSIVREITVLGIVKDGIVTEIVVNSHKRVKKL